MAVFLSARPRGGHRRHNRRVAHFLLPLPPFCCLLEVTPLVVKLPRAPLVVFQVCSAPVTLLSFFLPSVQVVAICHFSRTAFLPPPSLLRLTFLVVPPSHHTQEEGAAKKKFASRLLLLLFPASIDSGSSPPKKNSQGGRATRTRCATLAAASPARLTTADRHLWGHEKGSPFFPQPYLEHIFMLRGSRRLIPPPSFLLQSVRSSHSFPPPFLLLFPALVPTGGGK